MTELKSTRGFTALAIGPARARAGKDSEGGARLPSEISAAQTGALSQRWLTAAAALIAVLLSLSGCAILPSASSAKSDFAAAPYPRSHYIHAVRWDFSTVGAERFAHGSDLWPCAWAADDNLYCAWGDGGGFDGDSDFIGRVSLGFARIEGMPSSDRNTLEGRNVWGDAPRYAEHAATFGGKVTSMVSVDGTLYGFGNLWTAETTASPVHRGGPGPVNTLIWSSDLGATWHVAPWESNRLGAFLTFGRDNAGAPDASVYIYYGRPGDATRLYLKRVSKEHLGDDPGTSTAYEYLTGVDARGEALGWSRNETDASPVFVDPKGVDPSVAYDAPIRRYLLTAGHNPGGTFASASAGKVGLFEAPHPWGPWATVGYYEDWGEFGSATHGDYLGLVLPPKWMSPDGHHLWAIFSSLGQYDSLNLVGAQLTVRASAEGWLPPR